MDNLVQHPDLLFMPEALSSAAVKSVGCWWLTDESLPRHIPQRMVAASPKIHTLPRCSPHVMIGRSGGGEEGSYKGLHSWQLWKAISAPELPMGSAENYCCDYIAVQWSPSIQSRLPCSLPGVAPRAFPQYTYCAQIWVSRCFLGNPVCDRRGLHQLLHALVC